MSNDPGHRAGSYNQFPVTFGPYPVTGGTKSITPADRGLLGAGEATRAFIDAQDAGAAHKVWSGGRAQDSNSVFLPMNRPATTDELMALRQVGERSGLGDVVDTGQGVTATQFYPGPPAMTPRGGKQTVADLSAALRKRHKGEVEIGKLGTEVSF